MDTIVYWILGLTFGATFWVYIAFFALCTAKRLLKAGVRLRPGMKVVCYFLLITGWPADVIFNIIQGSWEFGELRGITFTSRIKYYYEYPIERPREGDYEYWFKLLEVADTGHVTGG
jgi:hypothetical protein